MLGTWGFGGDRNYRLDKMSLKELVRAFFTHYAILVYIVLAVVSILLSYRFLLSWWQPVVGLVATAIVYPFAEYVLHRFVLHARFMYKTEMTAPVWKRIHYDHHQNPHDMSVLFGALYTTLPALIGISFPIGWLLAGLSGAFAAIAAAMIAFTFYEFIHCMQHLPYTPKNNFLRSIKKRHLAHHFHSEQGNFGITSNLWDRILGTIYESQRDVPRSPTTFNLGYTAEERERYPWVAELSASEAELERRRTGRGNERTAP
ncbi:Fatty acid hydroxylase superfamily protein [Arboricoccus pini]|uniref:Fatty acid hydroxylase superfamily protein n=2 Tax=Arboricoccus pini TaxID=1963835 RepID=A0A212QMM3_9PROT|nr:Fatty acid hydroxylase superfamily protein [Arboricoccus pini]